MHFCYVLFPFSSAAIFFVDRVQISLRLPNQHHPPVPLRQILSPARSVANLPQPKLMIANQVVSKSLNLQLLQKWTRTIITTYPMP
jgi:hypothetical protein